MPKSILDILFQDDDYVAVMKPAGLATIPGRAETTSVLEVLAAQVGLPHTGAADPRIRVVHRLDKDTSGVLLFAKHSAAQRHVSHQFQNNETVKEYLALVVGRPLEPRGEIDAPLAAHPNAPQRMTITRHGGRPARTDWQLEATFRDYALLRVFPRTGKTHQIRVHLKSVGLPLAIDPIYNPLPPGKLPGIFLSHFKRHYKANEGENERPLIARLTLHAEKLCFRHLDHREIEIVSPLPKDFRAMLNMLTRHSSRQA